MGDNFDFMHTIGESYGFDLSELGESRWYQHRPPTPRAQRRPPTPRAQRHTFAPVARRPPTPRAQRNSTASGPPRHNAWNDFQHSTRGRGLSSRQMSEMYQQHNSTASGPPRQNAWNDFQHSMC